MGAQVSGRKSVNPFPTRDVRQTAHVPFAIAPGTVDTGNVPKDCQNCRNTTQCGGHAAAPPQPQPAPYAIRTVSYSQPTPTVRGNRIIQQAPITVITTVPVMPTAPMQPVQPPMYTEKGQGPMYDHNGQLIANGYPGQPMQAQGYQAQPMQDPAYPAQPMPAQGYPGQPMQAQGYLSTSGPMPPQGYPSTSNQHLHAGFPVQGKAGPSTERAPSAAPPPYPGPPAQQASLYPQEELQQAQADPFTSNEGETFQNTAPMQTNSNMAHSEPEPIEPEPADPEPVESDRPSAPTSNADEADIDSRLPNVPTHPVGEGSSTGHTTRTPESQALAAV